MTSKTLREPTTEEIALMRLNRMRASEYMILESETDSNQLVCIHRRRARRRTLEKRK